MFRLHLLPKHDELLLQLLQRGKLLYQYLLQCICWTGLSLKYFSRGQVTANRFMIDLLSVPFLSCSSHTAIWVVAIGRSVTVIDLPHGHLESVIVASARYLRRNSISVPTRDMSFPDPRTILCQNRFSQLFSEESRCWRSCCAKCLNGRYRHESAAELYFFWRWKPLRISLTERYQIVRGSPLGGSFGLRTNEGAK